MTAVVTGEHQEGVHWAWEFFGFSHHATRN